MRALALSCLVVSLVIGLPAIGQEKTEPEKKAPERTTDEKKAEPDKKADAPKLEPFKSETHGFSLSVPEGFEAGPEDKQLLPLAEGESQAVVFFKAKPTYGFASNVNVLQQGFAGTLKELRDANTKQIPASGFTLVSQKETRIGEREALLLEYEGEVRKKPLRFLAACVLGKGVGWVITCTTPKNELEEREKAFRACLETFRLEEK